MSVIKSKSARSVDSNSSIITAPVSIADVQEVLGLEDTDLGTLVSNGSINMWSKYKPVSLNKMFVSDTLNADKQSWTAQSGKLGWWLGGQGTQNASLVVPFVTSKKELEDGNGVWRYNKPSGGSSSPYRLSDFIGYYDNASEPLWPSYPSSTSFYVNETATFSIWTRNNDDEDYPDNCVTLKDIAQMLTQLVDGKLYPAIYIYNVTKRMGSYYSLQKPIDPDLDNEGYQFLINFGSGKPISEGGVGYVCDVGDVIRVFLLLCTQGGVEDNYFYGSFSMQTASYHVAYKEYTLKSPNDKPYTYDTVTVNITKNSVVATKDFDGYYVVNGDGVIFEIEGVVNIDASFKYTYASSHKPTGLKYALITDYEDSDGNHQSISSLDQGYIMSPEANYTYKLNDIGFTVYQSLAAAEKQEGGFAVNGMPLIKRENGYSVDTHKNTVSLFVAFDAYESDTMFTAYRVTYNGDALYEG